jgi:hypothetical protein
MHPLPVRDRRAAATVAGAPLIAPAPEQTLRTQPYTAWASAAATESPQNLGSGPLNDHGRAGERKPTYVHWSSMCVHPSLLPPSLWISPTAGSSGPGALRWRRNDSHNHCHCSSNGITITEITSNSSNSGSLSPVSKEQIISPSSSIITNVMLASTTLGFGDTRGRRDSSVPTPVMSTIDEDEREQKHGLSIAPSSFWNFPSGIEGLAADVKNSPHYHHSAHHFLPSWASRRASPLTSCLRPAPGRVPTWKNGARRSCRRRTRSRSRCGGCMCAPRPTCHMRSGWRIPRVGWWA